MAGKHYYSMFLDLAGQRAVVVGGGKVGLRKVRGLLEADAEVLVVSPEFTPELLELPVARVEREYNAADLDGAAIAFAATDDREVNRRVGEDARERRIPVNIADSLDECTFIVPARVTVEGVQLAISTGGADPAKAAAMRRRIELLLASG